MRMPLFLVGLIGITACSSPSPFYAVRLQSVAEESSTACSYAKEDVERIGYISQALSNELQEIKKADEAMSRSIHKIQRLK